jgi:enterochelin esterase-like enzyme
MIVVLPDAKTVHNGAMYSSSVTTGDFENYIARDVVSYIDAHYRTIASRESRGLVGHSMGGYPDCAPRLPPEVAAAGGRVSCRPNEATS